jgi:phosphoglycolate phosphatase-like HAD superfamily hydrolase
MSGFLLCLDFDGVICDSVLECLVSSWIAYYRELAESQPSHVAVGLRSDFAALRPFIRSGEDYILIQELLDRSLVIKNQQDFDSYISAAGAERMKRFKALFYKAREELVERDRDYWLSLNPVYPHMEEALRGLAGREELHIVSTKRANFIAEILASRGIEFPLSRIHYASNIEKIEIVDALLAESNLERSVFVDDQIDHLRREGMSAGIDSKLAAWGYIKPEWLETKLPGVEVVDVEGMIEIFNDFSRL